MKAYFRLLFAFIALGLLAAAVVGGIYVWERLIKPDRITQGEIEQIKKRKKAKVDYGKKFYDEAVSLIRTGRIDAGLGKLHQLMIYYRESAFYGEAKRIVGEVNIDRLLSKAPAPGKTEYIVKGGDALSRIANSVKSTVGYIVYVNGRMGSTLQRGDQLIVCPLEFSVLVNLAQETLTLRTADDKFFKEYALIDFKKPSGTKTEIDTHVKSLVISSGARLVPVGSKAYVSAEKELRCARPGVAIRAKTGDEEKDKYITGIFLSPEDVEEVALVVRPGTRVFVRK